MSKPGEIIAGTIDDILIALADGIRDAQRALNEAPPFDSFGRPMPTYHLPEVNFDIKMTAQSVVPDEPADTAIANGPVINLPDSVILPMARPMLKFSTPSPKEEGGDKLSLTSSISGRFVALPPNDGLPTIRLSAAALPTTGNNRNRLITITAQDVDGSPLNNIAVELNLDMPTSRMLSEDMGTKLVDKKPKTGLKQAVVLTNVNGSATTEFTVSPQEPKGLHFVISIEAGPAASAVVVET